MENDNLILTPVTPLKLTSSQHKSGRYTCFLIMLDVSSCSNITGNTLKPENQMNLTVLKCHLRFSCEIFHKVVHSHVRYFTR